MFILKKIIQFIIVVINIITNKFYLIKTNDFYMKFRTSNGKTSNLYQTSILNEYKPKFYNGVLIKKFNNSKLHRLILYILGIPDIYWCKIGFKISKDKDYYYQKITLDDFKIINKRIKIFNYYLFIYSYNVKGLSIYGFYKLDYALGIKGYIQSVFISEIINGTMNAYVEFNNTLHMICIGNYLDTIFKLNNKLQFIDIIGNTVQDSNTKINYKLVYDNEIEQYKLN